MWRQTQGLPVDGLAGYPVEIHPASLESCLLPQLQMYVGNRCGICRTNARTKRANEIEIMSLQDTDPMPQGKFKGQQMQTVPYWHLLWLEQQPFCRKDVRQYIEENRDVLELEQKRDKYRRPE